jgi:hypothetical protein
MPETAGSVSIDIGGNLAPFEAALAKARQMADLFDQQVSKKLGNTGASEAGLAKIAGLIEQTNALLTKMTGTVATTDASMNKFAADTEKAASAIDDVRSSASAASPAVGKLGSEFNSATSAIQRATMANQQFSASSRSLAAASNLKLADGTAASTEEMQAFAVALDDIRAKYNPLFGTIRQYLSYKDEVRVATKLGALSENEASAAISKSRQETLAAIGVLKGHTDALKGHGAAAGLGATQMMALTHAVRSFGEQIAMGASPIQAFTAQMNHLSYAAERAANTARSRSDIGNMALGLVSRFARVGVAVAGLAVGFEYVRDQAAQTERRTVGFGETAVAIFQTIRDDLRSNFGPALAVIFDPVIYAFKQLGSAAVDIAELVINSFHAAFVDVTLIWDALPDSFGLTFTAAANYGIDALNLLVKKTSDAVDEISKALNNIPGVNIPLLNAGNETIPPIDGSKYIASLDKLVADRNAAIQKIMSSTPIRDFGQQVIDRIQTNHALEGLDALANVDFGKSIGGANGLGNAIGGIGSNASGVGVTIGGMAQQVINVTKAFEDAKRAQLGQLVSAQQNLVQMNQQAADLQKTLAAAGQKSVSDVFGSFFSDTAGARQAIADTASSIDNLFKQFDAGRESAKDLNTDIERIRQTLLAMGGDPVAINAFLNSVVNGQLQVRQLKSNVDGLSQSIRSIPNRTVTITVKTQQIGSGTQSIYDVPNSSGGTSGVGVTRYGGVAGQQSGPSITANQVPSTGYGSMGGSSDSNPTSTVNVWRFATGGMIHPGDTQQVSFFKSPDETVGIFTPGQMQALADPQSGFTGTQPTANDNRAWTVLMNVEGNTRKTAQILDDIKTSMASSSSALGGSSYGGSSSGLGSGQQDQLTQQYLAVLKQIRSNFQAAGIVGGGQVGYNSNGLGATPEQIARNIVYGGMSPIGSAGTNTFERDSLSNYNYAIRSAFRGDLNFTSPTTAERMNGFNSGGMIAPGDTQQVKFFKSPDEAVAIFTPQQLKAIQGANQNQPAAASADGRPIVINQTHNWNGDAPPSKDSIAEMKRQFALALREGLRSINGR